MTNYNGFGLAGWDQYEDLTSLKKYIRANIGRLYDGHYINEIYFSQNTLSTGSKVACESFENGAIANIGKTELTVTLYAAADEATHAGVVCTLVYKSNDGVEHTALATGTDGLNTTQVAFVPAITDFYCAVSFTSSSTVSNENLEVSTAAGAAQYATITTTATAATEAQMFGVGSVYSRSHTDHPNADEKVNYLDYMTPWGEVKKCAVSTLTTTSSDEIIFYESDATTTVKDFWQPIAFHTNAVTTSDTNERLLCDVNAATNGGGGDVYGCIDEGMAHAKFSGWRAGEDGVTDTWFVGIGAHGFIETALGDMYLLYINLTPYGETIEKEIVIQFQDQVHHDFCIQLAADTEVTISIADIDAAGHVTVEAHYLVAKRI